MGFLGSLVSKLTGKSAGASAIDVVTSLIGSNGPAGLSKLVTDLKSGGLSEAVDSWVSTGANKVVSSEQVQHAMSGKLGQIATSLGVTPQQAAAQLTTALPHVIDKLTPGGKLPTADELRAGLSKLKRGG